MFFLVILIKNFYVVILKKIYVVIQATHTYI